MRSVLVVVGLALGADLFGQSVDLRLPKQEPISKPSIAVLLVGFGVTALAAQETVTQNEGDLYKGFAVATFAGTVAMNINWKRGKRSVALVHQ